MLDDKAISQPYCFIPTAFRGKTSANINAHVDAMFRNEHKSVNLCSLYEVIRNRMCLPHLRQSSTSNGHIWTLARLKHMSTLLNTKHGIRQGVLSIGEEEDPFIISGTGLPSMCGGAVICVYDMSNITGKEFTAIIKCTSDYSTSVTGGTSIEDEGILCENCGECEDDCYCEDGYSNQYHRYNGEIKSCGGLKGQILINFNKSMRDSRKEAVLKFILDELEPLNERVGIVCDAHPATTEVRWLSDGIVALLTKYSAIVEGFDEDELYSSAALEEPFGSRHLRHPSIFDMLKGDWVNLLDISCLTYLCASPATDTEGSKREFIAKTFPVDIWPDIARRLWKGKTVVLTDNLRIGDIYGSSSSRNIQTKDVIMWMMENKATLNLLAYKEYARKNHMNMRLPNLPADNAQITIKVFSEASNPNEGAHPIIGIALTFSEQCHYINQTQPRSYIHPSDSPDPVKNVYSDSTFVYGRG